MVKMTSAVACPTCGRGGAATMPRRMRVMGVVLMILGALVALGMG